jgi:response regulator RpfG family c-di-GMP phosphodiesterase
MVAQLADVLAWYGAVGDAASGLPAGFAARKAAAAVSLGQVGQLDAALLAAIPYAGLLHAVGTIGNPAYRKGEKLPERYAKMESWDVPAQGARICESIAALPVETADIVRWQSECWDGTGFPDQLRWHSIPAASQYLALADAFCRSTDPDDAHTEQAAQSGRAYGPEAARIFTMWYHIQAHDLQPLELPLGALKASEDDAEKLLDQIADRIDEHNGAPGRWRRVAHLANATARELKLDQPASRLLALCSRLYGAGELSDHEVEDAQFDPLARLGIEHRAKHATLSASLVKENATLKPALEILRARSEWFDGTGKPHGLKHNDIPAVASILSAVIAYDTLSEVHRTGPVEHRGAPAGRMDTAAGTQFNPEIVRALLEAAKAIA